MRCTTRLRKDGSIWTSGSNRTDLRVRVLRVSCAEHGVLQVELPWAWAGSGFTLMMEGLILLLAQLMSVSAAARLLCTTDHRL